MNINNPEFWQERYCSNNIPWDTQTTTPALIDSINHSEIKKIAILGCGYSKDSIFLANKNHLVYPIDFAEKPIQHLNDLKIKDNLDNLFPIQQDIFNIGNEYDNFFDIVIEYTCFCAIDPQRRIEYASLVNRILDRKGQFIALFFPTRIRENIDEGPPFYVNLEETLSIFENNFNIVEIDKNPNSIKPRKGFEVLVIMDKR
tara:strand:+ start:2375 stop:2977 length:603 start_codon:yes stop_codon:yes gene_type:complete